MRTRPSIAGFVLVLASTCFAQQPTPAPAVGDFAPLKLPPALVRAPDDKNHNPVLDGAWTTKAVDVDGLRTVVSFPSEWMVREQASGVLRLQLASLNGQRVSGVTLMFLGPTPLQMNAPIPTTMMTQLSRDAGGSGVPVSDIGQAKFGSRYWIWIDALAPEATRRPPESSEGPAFERLHIWMFHTTEAGRMIQLNLIVGMPKGSTAGDTDAEVHAAGDVFLEILKRITFEPATTQPAASPPDNSQLLEGVIRVGQSGVTTPIVVTQVQPRYTADAMRAHISGIVVLECVVETDGSVGYVRVRQSLDAVNGLDDEAVKAAKQWRFKPGTKDGIPVRVLVSIEMSFTLRPTPPSEDGK